MSQPCVFMAEDEWIVASDLRDTIEEAGFQVEGLHRDIPSAMLACQKRKPDLAILDIQLSDDMAYELARRLADEDVPIIFHSGYSSEEDVGSKFPDAITLRKPCPPADMIAAVYKKLGIVH